MNLVEQAGQSLNLVDDDEPIAGAHLFPQNGGARREPGKRVRMQQVVDAIRSKLVADQRGLPGSSGPSSSTLRRVPYVLASRDSRRTWLSSC